MTKDHYINDHMSRKGSLGLEFLSGRECGGGEGGTVELYKVGVFIVFANGIIRPAP